MLNNRFRKIQVHLAVAGLILAAFPVSGSSPTTEGGVQDTKSLGERVVHHATRLAAYGPRPASSAGEQEAARYLSEELTKLGLDVREEVFAFDDFEVESAHLVLAGREVEPMLLGVDPFHGEIKLRGMAVALEGGADPTEDLKNRLVITDHPITQLLVADREPQAVICVSSDDFEWFSGQDDRSATLEVAGIRRTRESRNLVATIGPAAENRILVTAHLDAYRDSPGANDNGTGLGALIELSRIFVAADPQPALTLVAFGAEEVGAVGSRAYIERHRRELATIQAVVNLDTVGGHDGPQLGTDAGIDAPTLGSPESVTPPGLKGLAWEGLDGRWRMLHPAILAQVTRTDSPGWLEKAAADAAKEVGVELGRRSLISDHRSFTQAGVPATSIQSGKHTIHSPEDTVEDLDVEVVDAGCRVAEALIRRLTATSPSSRVISTKRVERARGEIP
jgi:hypothetical protein